MNPELEETIYADFITSSPTTGAATDADTTPTCEVFEDATDMAILTPTVVKRTGKTGNYRIPIACTAANGFESGKSYNLIVSATVGGVAAKAVLQTFQMRTNGPDDLAASILTRAAAGDAMALTAGERTTLGGVIWQTLTSGLTTVGSIGKLLVDNINATIASRSTYAGGDTAGTTTLLSRIASALTITAGKVDVNDKTGFALTGAYDAAKTAAATGDAMTLVASERTAVAVSVWDRLTSALTAAGSIGKLIIDNLNATVASRSTYAGGDTPGTTTLLSRIASALTITGGKVDMNDKTGFALTSAYDSAKTASSQASVNTVMTVTNRLDSTLELDGLVYRFTANALEQAPTSGLGEDTAPTANEVADAVLKRDWTAISGEAPYSLLNANRMLRNVWDASNGTLVVKREDGTTTAWSRPLTTDPEAQPIVAAGPSP